MADDHIHIRLARLGETTGRERYTALLGTMPDSIRSELLAYKRWPDARASLAGKLMLRQLLHDLQLPCSLDDLRYEHKDRPVISGEFDFNISHSGELVVVALARGRRIGIDAERHRPLDKNLFRKYFSDSEWEQLEIPEPLPAFFRLWAIKEAAIKCDGRGVEVLGKTTVLDAETVRCDEAVLYYREIYAGSGYACAVCSAQPFGEVILETTDPFGS